MSFDEQIEHLESEKRACIARYDRQINELWMQKQKSEDSDSVEVNGRTLLMLRGKPLSRTIIDERGSY